MYFLGYIYFARKLGYNHCSLLLDLSLKEAAADRPRLLQQVRVFLYNAEMLEKAVESRIRSWAKKNDVIFIKLDASLYPGIPDRMAVLPNGQVTFLEIKRPGGRVSERQKCYLAALSGYGHNCLVAYSANEAIEHLESLL